MTFSLGVSLRLFCCRISSLVIRRKAKRARVRLIRVGGPRLLNPDQRGLHNVVGASTSGLLSLVTGTCRSVGSLLRLRLTSASRQRAGVGAAPRAAHAVSLVEALRWHGSSERLELDGGQSRCERTLSLSRRPNRPLPHVPHRGVRLHRCVGSGRASSIALRGPASACGEGSELLFASRSGSRTAASAFANERH